MFKKIQRPLLYVLLFYVSSRLILLFIGLITIKILGNQVHFPSAVYPYTGSTWLDLWGHWDTSWYNNIAANGYSSIKVQSTESLGQANYAFFPLYPALMMLLGKIIGSVYIAGLIISNLSLLVSGYLIYKIASIENDNDTSLRSVKYLFLFPTAFLLSGVLTESLFLAIILGCYLFARRQQWFLSALLGCLAAATRSVGFLIIIPVFLEYFKTKGYKAKKVDRSVFYLGLIPVGIIAFAIYNKVLTGDFLAFVHVQEAWGRSTGNPLYFLIRGIFLKEGIYGFASAMFTFIALALITIFYKKLRLSEFVLCLYSIFIPLSSGLVSMPRYILVIFPIVLILAKVSKDKVIDDLLSYSLAGAQISLFIFWVLGTYLVM